MQKKKRKKNFAEQIMSNTCITVDNSVNFCINFFFVPKFII